MPNIPVIRAKTSPVPQIRTGNAWGAVEDAGNEMARIGNRIKDAENRLKSLKIEGAMKTGIGEFKASMLMRNDYDNFDTETDSYISKARNEYMEMAGGNSRMAEAVGIAFDGLSSDMKSDVTAHKIKLMSDDAVIELDHDADRTIQEMASAPDEETKNKILSRHIAKHEVLQQSGLIDRKTSEKTIEKVREQSIEQAIRFKIDNSDGTSEQKYEWFSQQSPEKWGLERSSYNRIKSDLRAQYLIDRHQKAEYEKAIKEAQKINDFNAMLQYHAGNLTPEKTVQLVSAKQISPSTGTTIMNNFARDLKEQQKEEEEEIKEKNKNIWFQNFMKLSSEVDDVIRGTRKAEDVLAHISETRDKNQIDSVYGKSLVGRLKETKEKDSPIKNPAYINKLKVIDKIREVKNRNAKSNIQKILKNDKEWSNKRTEFEEWMKENPKATTKEINERFEELIKDERKEASFGIIDSFLSAFSTRKIAEEATSKVDYSKAKEIDVMSVMPDATQHKGRIIDNPETGQSWKSDGNQWVEIK